MKEIINKFMHLYHHMQLQGTLCIHVLNEIRGACYGYAHMAPECIYSVCLPASLDSVVRVYWNSSEFWQAGPRMGRGFQEAAVSVR